MQESPSIHAPLAGSERQKVAESEGERVKQASSINRSLASLGLVIKKLVEGSAVPGGVHVSYRDSRLTFLLQDSLGGNAKTVMIANISLAASCFRETQSTLGFAQRAKMIKNKVGTFSSLCHVNFPFVLFQSGLPCLGLSEQALAPFGLCLEKQFSVHYASISEHQHHCSSRVYLECRY